jgi:flagella basal body P-ring formation protein FlgA
LRAFPIYGLRKVTRMKVSINFLVKNTASLWLGSLVLFANHPALAQEVSTTPVVLEAARLWLNEAMAHLPQTAKTPLRMVLVLGELDSRLRLSPCARVEPYVPVGARLWGKTRIGLRCVEGATKWNVFLPVTVHAYGPAWVVRGNLSAGTTLTEDDAMQAEVDWSASPSSVVGKASQWVGTLTAGAMTTGQVLRQASIRPAQVFQNGAQVRVLAQGPGFTISSAGQALSAGVVGQLTQVKMDNGRIIPGMVVDSRTVKLDL